MIMISNFEILFVWFAWVLTFSYMLLRISADGSGKARSFQVSKHARVMDFGNEERFRATTRRRRREGSGVWERGMIYLLGPALLLEIPGRKPRR